MNRSERARQFFRSRLPLILGIYIVLQPLLDVLTTPSANAGSAISVGVVARTLFMAFAFLYVVFISRFEGKKWAMLYLAALIVYLVLFMLQMLRLGGISLCIANVKELVKVLFLPFTALFLLAVYREYRYRISARSVAWAGGLYAFVILVAYVTGTSLTSYRSGYGYKGWFYAANEVGCIIAITAPIAIWFCLKQMPAVTQKTWWKGVLIALCLFSIIFAANYIGTKIIFAAVLLYCAAAFVWCLVRAIRERSRGNTAAVIVMAVMVVFTIVLFLSSPLNGYLKNVYGDLLDTSTDEILDKWSPVTEPDEPSDPSEPSAPIENLQTATEDTWLRNLITSNAAVEKLDAVLSRRLVIAAAPVQEFIEGSLLTKLVGVGYANSPTYTRSVTRLIELDGLSILIRQGILGVLLYLVPYVLGIVYLIVQFFKHPLKRLSSLKYCSYLYAALMAFAISMVVGHVMGAPAVCIFMLAVTVNTVLMAREQDRGVEIEASLV